MIELYFMIFILNGVILLVGIGMHFIMNDPATLKSKGFSDEYIAFMKSSSKKTSAVTFLLLLIAQALVGFIVHMVAGPLTTKLYYRYVFTLSIICVIAYPVSQIRKKNIESKELAIKTNSDIIIDFDFKTLKLVFSLPLELPTSLMLFVYATFFLEHRIIIYLYLGMLWFYYAILRKSKYLNLATFRFNYSLLGKGIILFHFMLIFLFALSAIPDPESERALDNPLFTIVICGALAVKLVYYLKNYPVFKKEVEGKVPQMPEVKEG